MPDNRPVIPVPSLEWLVDNVDHCDCPTPEPVYPGRAFVTDGGTVYRSVPCQVCGRVTGFRPVRTDTALVFVGACQRVIQLLAATNASDRATIRAAAERVLSALVSHQEED